MKRIVVLLLAFLWFARPASAQGDTQSVRGGFTVLGSLGVGLQNGRLLDDTMVGLSGANLGIGGFISPNLAVLFRFSGVLTGFDKRFDNGFDVLQISGVGAGAIQYWIANRVIVEGGVGTGFWSRTDWFNSHESTFRSSRFDFREAERGLGLIVGARAVLFNWGKHNLVAGVEYAPAFVDPAVIHNIGFTVGYQFHNFR